MQDLPHIAFTEIGTLIQQVYSADTMLKRANAKAWNLATVGNLTKLNSPLKKQYTNAMYCSCNVCMYEAADGTKVAKAKYCKTRFCVVCNRIRTAKAINEYLPVVKNWQGAYFLTLTIPHTKDSDLNANLDLMQRTYNAIKNTRTARKMNLSGIWKLEVTEGSGNSGDHPHYHFITRTKREADYIRTEWLNRIQGANEKGNPEPVPCNGVDSLKELFKYVFKIGKTTKQVNGVTVTTMDFVATDRIFQALKGRRIYGAFGEAYNNRAKIELERKELAALLDTFVYEPAEWDWINQETGEALTGFKPTPVIEHFAAHTNPYQCATFTHIPKGTNVTVTVTDTVPVPLHTSQTAKVEYTTTTSTEAVQVNLSPNTGAHTGNGIALHLPYRGAHYIPPPRPAPKITPPKLE